MSNEHASPTHRPLHRKAWAYVGAIALGVAGITPLVFTQAQQASAEVVPKAQYPAEDKAFSPHRWAEPDGKRPEVTTAVTITNADGSATVKPEDKAKIKVSGKFHFDNWMTEEDAWAFPVPEAGIGGSAFFRPSMQVELPAGLDVQENAITVSSGDVKNKVILKKDGDATLVKVFFDYVESDPKDPSIDSDFAKELQNSAFACALSTDCRTDGHALKNDQTVEININASVAKDLKDVKQLQVDAQGQAWTVPAPQVETTAKLVRSTDEAAKGDKYLEANKCWMRADIKAVMHIPNGYGAWMQGLAVAEYGAYTPGKTPSEQESQIDDNGHSWHSLRPATTVIDGQNVEVNTARINFRNPRTNEVTAGQLAAVSADENEIAELMHTGEPMGMLEQDMYVNFPEHAENGWHRPEVRNVPRTLGVIFPFDYRAEAYSAPEKAHKYYDDAEPIVNVGDATWMTAGSLDDPNSDSVTFVRYYQNPNCSPTASADADDSPSNAAFPPIDFDGYFAVGSYARPSMSPAAAAVIDVAVKHRLGDTVFVDGNDNGVQDADEPGLKDVAVTVTDAHGGSVCETKTDDSGKWGCDVADGEYSVTFTKPEGYSFTQKLGEPESDDVQNNRVGDDGVVTVTVAGADYLRADAGVKKNPVAPSSSAEPSSSATSSSSAEPSSSATSSSSAEPSSSEVVPPTSSDTPQSSSPATAPVIPILPIPIPVPGGHDGGGKGGNNPGTTVSEPNAPQDSDSQNGTEKSKKNGGVLANTGADVLILAVMGMALLGAGATVLALRRKRD